jgi:hypothetical protein
MEWITGSSPAMTVERYKPLGDYPAIGTSFEPSMKRE